MGDSSFPCWRSWAALIADKVDPLLLEGLRSMGFGVVREAIELEDDQLISMIPNYDVLIVGDSTLVSLPVLEAGKNGGRLKIVGRVGVGIDNVDLEAIAAYDVLLLRTPDVFTISVAEFTCALLMALGRNLPQACDSMRKLAAFKMYGGGQADNASPDVELHFQANFHSQCKWSRNIYTGVELYSKVLGIVGFGRVGQAVAQRMRNFGMKIIAYDPNVPASVFEELGVESLPLVDVFRHSDFLTLHASLNADSCQIVNADTISHCKRGFCLVNCAHHSLINESDLIAALNSSHCAAAAIDTYEVEPTVNVALVGHPKILCTPELTTCTIEAKKRVSIELLQQLRSAIEQNWQMKTDG